MKAVGYSQTALAKKLGIKEGSVIRIVNAPAHYFDLFTDFPENVHISEEVNEKKHLVHLFVYTEIDLHHYIPDIKKQIHLNGSIWVSWPKKASKVATDVTKDVVRKAAFQNGLVDIKVCAVDEQWSGLKLVIHVKDRKSSIE